MASEPSLKLTDPDIAARFREMASVVAASHGGMTADARTALVAKAADTGVHPVDVDAILTEIAAAIPNVRLPKSGFAQAPIRVANPTTLPQDVYNKPSAVASSYKALGSGDLGTVSDPVNGDHVDRVGICKNGASERNPTTSTVINGQVGDDTRLASSRRRAIPLSIGALLGVIVILGCGGGYMRWMMLKGTHKITTVPNSNNNTQDHDNAVASAREANDILTDVQDKILDWKAHPPPVADVPGMRQLLVARCQQASDLCDQAQKLDHNLADAYYNQIVAYQFMGKEGGKLTDALQEARDAQEKFPTDPRFTSEIAQLEKMGEK